jgi:hypothetical protein
MVEGLGCIIGAGGSWEFGSLNDWLRLASILYSSSMGVGTSRYAGLSAIFQSTGVELWST